MAWTWDWPERNHDVLLNEAESRTRAAILPLPPLTRGALLRVLTAPQAELSRSCLVRRWGGSRINRVDSLLRLPPRRENPDHSPKRRWGVCARTREGARWHGHLLLDSSSGLVRDVGGGPSWKRRASW
jgi:hypothetical protein